MRFALAKSRLVSAGGIIVVLAFALNPAVYADTFPYLKAFGADSSSGGAFASSSGCSATGYQDPTDGNGSPATDNGGILTFANSAGGGSTDEFGAFSLGTIDNSPGSAPGGFYSDQHTTSASKKLTFANTSAADGGLFEGGTPSLQCIPNYYSKLQSSAAAWAGNYNPATPGQFKASGAVTLSGGTINGGSNFSLYVNGNVSITGNITYGSGYTEANVPKFALVVKGNIYISNNVTQLDGVYIAQPTSISGSGVPADGIIWTCYDTTTPSATNSSYGPWILANCANTLTVNGALISQWTNYRRIVPASNVTPSSPSSGESAASNNGAEVINYTPSTVIGGPFFNVPPPPSNLKIDSLISLPPLF